MPDEKNEKRKIGVTHCVHGTSEYSLGIHLEDIHVDLGTSDYGKHPGNHVEFTIFELTADDIQDLAIQLAHKALELKAIELRERVAAPASEEPANAGSK